MFPSALNLGFRYGSGCAIKARIHRSYGSFVAIYMYLRFACQQISSSCISRWTLLQFPSHAHQRHNVMFFKWLGRPQGTIQSDLTAALLARYFEGPWKLLFSTGVGLGVPLSRLFVGRYISHRDEWMKWMNTNAKCYKFFCEVEIYAVCARTCGGMSRRKGV